MAFQYEALELWATMRVPYQIPDRLTSSAATVHEILYGGKLRSNLNLVVDTLIPPYGYLHPTFGLHANATVATP